MSHVPVTGTKTCRKCEKEKHVTEFRIFKRYGQKDREYRRSWCMECDREYARKWRKKNKGYHAKWSRKYRHGTSDTKVCTKCEKERPVKDFYLDNRLGLRPVCRFCSTKKQRAYRRSKGIKKAYSHQRSTKPRCPKCKTRKKRTDFSTLQSGKIANWCKSCNNEYNTEYRRALGVPKKYDHQNAVNPRCSKCRIPKTRDDFYKIRKNGKEWLQGHCKECAREDRRQRRKKKSSLQSSSVS